MISQKTLRTGQHTPVLFLEVIKWLNVRSGGVYCDATFGRGGHARAILERACRIKKPGEQPVMIAFEQNPYLAEEGRRVFSEWENCLRIFNANFDQLEQILRQNHLFRMRFDGVLFDLGLSSWHLETSGEGFSFLREEPLDMRFNPKKGFSAAEWLNRASEKEIFRALSDFGEETSAKDVARLIAVKRRSAPIRTTSDLLDCIRLVHRKRRDAPLRGRLLRSARRVFQAVRIVVNHELEALAKGLPQAVNRLATGGRVVVISYHSLEDRLVKDFFRTLEGKILKHLTARKVVRPTKEEIRANPKARSARLRCAERLVH